MDINVKGVWLCMKYQLPALFERGGGAIVNNSSIAGLIGFPGVPIYTASKHAVVGLTRALALEHAKSGVRINAVCPGAVDTDMFERFASSNPGVREQILAMHPMGRMGKPAEIASAVLWLCSEGAGFVTGQTLALDGGYVAA
jgi:NAD(P)-dependent dehydrogenase (short-subunit alcohol dehydrogenase family)